MPALALLWTAAPVEARAGPDGGGVPAGDAAAGEGQRGSAGRGSSPQELLDQAIGCYQRGEFDQARGLLGRLLVPGGGVSSRILLEGHLYLGFVHLAFGAGEEALDCFERALAIDPELTLPPGSPKLQAAFEQARRRFRIRQLARDHDPPLLTHRPPDAGRFGAPLRIEVQARDISGVKRVELHYRQAGNRGFSSVTMEPAGSGGHVATVPGMAMARPGVEYFIEAWDSQNNGPGLKGSAAAPILVKVSGGPAPARAQEERRWYQRWWIWAGVAGVVAVTGGVVAAVYLTRDKTWQAGGAVDGI